MIALVLVVTVMSAGPGCEKDTDCKGDRLCENGRCVSPAASTPDAGVSDVPRAPPAVSTPPEYPRIVRENGQVCMEYLDPSGRVQRECRAEGGRSPPRTPSTAPSPDGGAPSEPPIVSTPPDPAEYPRIVRENGQVCMERLGDSGRVERDCRAEGDREATRVTSTDDPAPTVKPKSAPRRLPVARVAGLGALQAGVTFAGGASVASLTFTGSVGVMFRAGIGVVAVANAQLMLTPVGVLQLYSVGPAFRVGHKSHVTLGLSPTLGILPPGLSPAGNVGVSTTLYAHLVAVLGDHFSFLLHPSLLFDRSGAVFTLTGGMGITF